MAWRYCQVHCNVSERSEMDLLYAMVKLHHPLNAIVHFCFYVCLRTRCHSRSKWLHACPWPCVNFYKLAMLLKRCIALSRYQNGKWECILTAILLNDAPFPLFSQCRLLWTLLHGKRAFQSLWSLDKRAFSRTSGWTFRHPDIAFLWNMASLNFTLMIDNTPKIMLYAVDRLTILIRMPLPVGHLPLRFLTIKRANHLPKLLFRQYLSHVNHHG